MVYVGIAGMLVVLVFAIWMLIYFAETWVSLLVNGMPLVLIGLRSFRDVYYHNEQIAYVRASAIALLVIIVFNSYLSRMAFWRLTLFAVLAFALVYLWKGVVALDSRRDLRSRVAKLKKLFSP